MASVESEIEFKDLTEIVDQLDKREKERQELAKNEDKLMVDTLRIRAKSKLVENVGIDSIDRVFHLWIDRQLQCQTSKAVPKLNLPENQRKIDIDLEIGFEDGFQNNQLIEDYFQYRNKKWEYFLKSIKDNDLLDKYKPDFVSFGGPVADILATVYDTSIQWIICAEKFNDVIYFYKTRIEYLFKGDYHKKQTFRRSYCGLKLLYLVTDRDKTQMSEFDKCFAINYMSFGGHKILTLNELDAVDDNDKAVDIKMTKIITSAKEQDFFHKKKLLRFWSKGCVQGVDRIVIGNTESNNVLLDIEERKVNDIPNLCAHKWSDTKCLDFLNRFLAFMKSCITEEKIIYDFYFRSGEEFVVCHRINPNKSTSLLPEFYGQS